MFADAQCCGNKSAVGCGNDRFRGGISRDRTSAFGWSATLSLEGRFLTDSVEKLPSGAEPIFWLN